jgi:hypothetical protein
MLFKCWMLLYPHGGSWCLLLLLLVVVVVPRVRALEKSL